MTNKFRNVPMMPNMAKMDSSCSSLTSNACKSSSVMIVVPMILTLT